MATVDGMLGQAAPAAATLTTLYTVPGGKNSTTRLLLANRSETEDSVRIAVSPSGASLDKSHYLAFDQPLPGHGSKVSAPIKLRAADVVRVYSAIGQTSFGLNGSEEDN